MRSRWLILALVFSVMVNIMAIGTIGFHWWAIRRLPPPPQSLHGPLRGPMRDMLSLSPAQIERLDKETSRTLEEINELRRHHFETRAHLFQLLRSPSPDSMAVEEVLRDISESQMALERHVIHNILRMKRILTPEQQEKLLRSLERHRKPEFRNRMRPHPFGPEGRPGRSEGD
jgi:Spy/CpxP family protein refolding chaperone